LLLWVSVFKVTLNKSLLVPRADFLFCRMKSALSLFVCLVIIVAGCARQKAKSPRYLAWEASAITLPESYYSCEEDKQQLTAYWHGIKELVLSENMDSIRTRLPLANVRMCLPNDSILSEDDLEWAKVIVLRNILADSAIMANESLNFFDYGNSNVCNRLIVRLNDSYPVRQSIIAYVSWTIFLMRENNRMGVSSIFCEKSFGAKYKEE
jgi:hypothetical protein